MLNRAAHNGFLVTLMLCKFKGASLPHIAESPGASSNRVDLLLCRKFGGIEAEQTSEDFSK